MIYEKSYPKTGAGARMLGEYSRWPLFRTVGIDSFFYTPPSARTLASYAAVLPEGFPCVSKVWDRITAHTFANPRDRASYGQENPDWLNPDLFVNEVLGPMQEHFASHIGPFVFEFQTISRSVQMSPADFAARLDGFFSRLPKGPPYSIELRNPEFLSPEYFAVLRTHGVAHLFNSWTRMPAIGAQLALRDVITANFIVARALLRPGRTYAKAVDSFAPYDHVQDENPELRTNLGDLARTALELRIPAYLIVNNRAEGCAPLTITGVARGLAGAAGK